MKVILATLNAKFIHTSLAIRLLKAYSGNEFDIDLAEYTIKDPVMNIVSDLFQRRPDVVGFSCYIWNIEETIKVIRLLKKVLPETAIVLGGPEVSYDTQHWMERVRDVDFIVMGDGEETFHQLLQEAVRRPEVPLRVRRGLPQRGGSRDQPAASEIRSEHAAFAAPFSRRHPEPR